MTSLNIKRKAVAHHEKTANCLIVAALYHLEAANCCRQGKDGDVFTAIHLARKYMSRANETQGEMEIFI